MIFFATVIALLLSILVILYFLDFVDKPKVKNVVRNEHVSPESLKRAITKTIKENQKKEPEKRLRICPVCGTVLDKNDYLIAAFDPVDDPAKKRRVQIYGCPYCFATDGVSKSREKLDPKELI